MLRKGENIFNDSQALYLFIKVIHHPSHLSDSKVTKVTLS